MKLVSSGQQDCDYYLLGIVFVGAQVVLPIRASMLDWVQVIDAWLVLLQKGVKPTDENLYARYNLIQLHLTCKDFWVADVMDFNSKSLLKVLLDWHYCFVFSYSWIEGISEELQLILRNSRYNWTRNLGTCRAISNLNCTGVVSLTITSGAGPWIPSINFSK